MTKKKETTSKETTVNKTTKFSKVPKKNDNPENEEKKAKKRKYNITNFKTYIHRLLKQLYAQAKLGKDKKITISGKAMNVMNSFVIDIFERLAEEAGSLSRKKKTKTLSAKDIQVATRILLSGDLAKHAIVQGMTAVHNSNPILSDTTPTTTTTTKKSKKQK